MSTESVLFAQLSTDLGHERIYPAPLPLGAILPAVTYQRITTRRVRSHDGTSLVGPLFQFSCWATTPAEARALAREVVASWEARIGYALVEDQREMYESGGKLFRCDVDVRLWVGLDEEVETSG